MSSDRLELVSGKETAPLEYHTFRSKLLGHESPTSIDTSNLEMKEVLGTEFFLKLQHIYLQFVRSILTQRKEK